MKNIGKILACRMNAVNREFVYIENSSLGAKLDNLTPNLPPTWPILVPLGPSWRQHGLQEASKWSPTGGPDRMWGHLSAKRAAKGPTPQKGDHFPAKCAKIIVKHSV